jgi:hypothetical protein
MYCMCLQTVLAGQQPGVRATPRRPEPTIGQINRIRSPDQPIINLTNPSNTAKSKPKLVDIFKLNTANCHVNLFRPRLILQRSDQQMELY